MSIPEACLWARVLAARRAPLLPVRVAVQRMSASTTAPRTDQHSPAEEERPTYAPIAHNKSRPNARRKVRSPIKTAKDRPDERPVAIATMITDAAAQLRSARISKRQAWKVLQEGILAVNNEGVPPEEKANIVPAIRNMVEVIIGSKRWGPGGTRDGPSISELMTTYIDAGKGRKRPPLMRCLTRTLTYLVGGRTSEEEAREALEEVVAVWVALFHMSNYVGPDGIRVPSIRSRRIQQLARGPEPFTAMVNAAVVPFPLADEANLTPLLLATYVYIEEGGLRGSEAVAPIEPLLGYMEKVMGDLWTDSQTALDEFKEANGSGALRRYVAARLSLLKTSAGPEMGPEQLHRRLSRGLSMRSPEHVRQTWTMLSRQIEALAPTLDEVPELRERYAGLLNFCVCIWCALGREDIDTVLGFMRGHGFEYTVKTYTSMIEGWKLARQPRNIAALWERLESERVRLDAVIWSARISALMACGLEKPALRALHEMGQLWDAAVKQEAEGEAVRPEIGPVNAALAGVLRSKGVLAAPAILSWAAKYDVEADVATYNMLLRAMLHEGRSEEADVLLRDMNSRGVAADAATFTIIVEEVLGAAANQDEDRRLEAVRGIFAAIEASGQSAKAATYAKMVHVLLENTSGGSAVECKAVREVLSHMQRRSAGLTSHVFTIIANHLLAAGDTGAVRAMIATWGLSSSDRVDGVFWEVVIRGFAGAGLAGEARDMFFALRRETRVALGVLDQLLVGLLEAGDVEGARELVREVKERMRDGGVQGAGEGGERFLRHRFWHVVAENGLDV